MKLHATRETCLAMEILSTFHTHILSVFAGNKQPSFAIVRILETKITLKNKVCLGLACALSYFFLQFLGQSDVIVATSGVVGFLFYNILPSNAPSFIALPPAHPAMQHFPPLHLLIEGILCGLFYYRDAFRLRNSHCIGNPQQVNTLRQV